MERNRILAKPGAECKRGCVRAGAYARIRPMRTTTNPAVFLAAIVWASAAVARADEPVDPADVAEAALRDGLPALAFDTATNALSRAETPEARERAFSLAAAARERVAAPADMIAWLDETVPAVLLPGGVPPAADYFRARALAALGRHGEAIRLLRPLAGGALAGSPLESPARRDLAYSLGVSGRVSEALALLDKSAPGNAAAALDLARLFLSAGRPREALGLLEPLCADGADPSPAAASAALLRALALGNAGDATNALEALEAVPGADPDTRALALASRAVLLGPAATNALALAGEALALAESAAARLDCGLALLRLRARAGGDGDGVAALARSLVAAAPGFPPVAAGVRDAASARLAAGDAETALALADLFVASFADSADEAAVLRLRAEALAALDRWDEAAAAHLRAAEFAAATGDEAARHGSLLAAAAAQRSAGNPRLAAATLAQLHDAAPPIRAAAAFLSAECLADLEDPGALDAFLAVADDFPDAPERAAATFRAAGLVAAAAGPADTNALARAEALYALAGGSNETARTAIDGLAARLAVPDGPASAGDAPAPGAAPADEPPVPVPADPDDEAASAQLHAASTLGTALVAVRAGRFAEALPLLDNAAATPGGGPAAEQASALRPSVLTALGRSAEALAAYRVFTNEHPASVWLDDARFWHAAHAFNGGEWSEAADLMAGYAREFPGTPEAEHALHDAAVALFRANRFEEVGPAVRELAAAFPSSPLLPAARFAHGEALCRLLRFDEAADLFRDLESSSDPAVSVRAAVRLGDCLFTLGGDDPSRYADSLAAYRRALESPLAGELGLAAECAYKTGRSIEKAGDPAGALSHYYEAVLLPYERAPEAGAAPWYSRAVFAAAAILRSRGDDAGADALLSRLARSDLPGAEEAGRLLERAERP